MKRIRALAGLASIVTLMAGSGTSTASESTGYREIAGHYEEIRLALLGDTLDGVVENAAAIRNRADELAQSFDADRAGVEAERAEDAKALLPEIVAAAEGLANSGDLGAARAEYFELSKPIGRYRKLAGTEGSIVVYCPMAKKAWIQPEGEIGNPYMGKGMPRCGEVIAD
jgi:hypothetical protein